DRRRSLEPSPAGPVFGNRIEATLWGVSAWGSWRVSTPWRMSAGVAEKRLRFELPPGSLAVGRSSLGDDPNAAWFVRNSFDLGTRWELDVNVRGAGRLPNSRVPAYGTLDARLGHRLHRDLELSIVGRDL